MGHLDTSQRANERSELQRVSSHDQITGAPLEDLRRRLTAMNGSNASFGSLLNRERGSLMPQSQRTPTSASDVPQHIPARPSSPTESIISATNSVSQRPRFSIGSFDGVKVAPAVGSIRANAVGLLEAPGRAPTEGDLERLRSGLTSPVSFAQNLRELHSPSISAGQGLSPQIL